MNDPLSIVRRSYIAHRSIDYVDHCYNVEGYKIHESTKTCFKRTLKGDDYFYTLRDVLFFMENAEMGVAEFRRLCVQNRITAVVEQDKQSLRHYLLGEIDSCPQLDANMAAASQLSSTAAVSTSGASAASHAQHAASSNAKPAVDVGAKASAIANKHSNQHTSGSSYSNENNNSQLSFEEMQEQRSKHAALIDQSLLRPALAIDSVTAPVNLKKRKAFHLEKSDVFDQAFIKADQQLLAALRFGEIAAHTRATVLTTRNADFSFALKLFNDHVLRPKDTKGPSKSHESDSRKHASANSHPNPNPAASGHRQPGSSSTPSAITPSSTAAAALTTAPSTARSYGTPIIIVPATLTSIISSLNVRDFLEKSNYVSNEDKKKAGATREPVMLINRTLPNGSRLEYKVIDTVVGFPDKDWDRVVAVLVTGQDWQFQGWKWSKPVELFTKVLGIHVTMDDRLVSPAVQSWNCKTIQIKKFKRHLDAGVVNEFWSHLDNFMRTNKPYLIQQPK